MTITLQRCAACGSYQYPRRDICRLCLSDQLVPEPIDGHGTLLARAVCHHSLEPAFTDMLPVPIGAVKFDCGPQVIAMLDPATQVGARVRLHQVQGPLGPIFTNHLGAGDIE
jgi:uncharacterized OB-fold protein